MSATNPLESKFLSLYFTNANAANIGDATGLRGSTTAGSLFVSLHTADPGEGGTQSTNEATYTSYARVAVARTSGGWAVTGNSVSPVANIDFPAATGGTETLTHFGVGSASSGAGVLYYSGTITPNIAVSSGVIPRLTTASTITEE